jgi:hypothetical protein
MRSQAINSEDGVSIVQLNAEISLNLRARILVALLAKKTFIDRP